MVEKLKFAHDFLDLKGEGMEDRTFLGGTSLSARSTLFWALGLTSLLMLGVVFVHVDQRIGAAMDDWRAGRELSILMTRMQSGLARAETLEKTYVIENSRELADAFSEELSRVGMALDESYGIPQSGPVRRYIATLRDGVEQYGQQFTQFVIAEEALSLNTNTGISPHLQSLSARVSREFTAAGLGNLADQIARTSYQGREVLRFGKGESVRQIREQFRDLFQFLGDSNIPMASKRNLEKQLQTYETDLMKSIDSRLALARERLHFGEILAYLAPSTDALREFTKELDLSTVRRLDRARSFARYSIAGSTALVFLCFMFAGILLFRSVISPLQDLAFAVARLASGDRGTQVPARGNADATGQIARALNKWINDMADVEMARRELDQVRAKLEVTIAETDRKVHAIRDPAEALRAESHQLNGIPKPTSQPNTALAAPIVYDPRPSLAAASNPALFAGEAGSTGPISLISQQLTHFSEYVTATAQDVERSETLIRNISEAMSHIEVLGNLVTAARDQVNLLAFRSSPRDSYDNGAENLIPFNGGERREVDAPMSREPMTMGRLDLICDTTNRAERTLKSVLSAMENINAVAQDIAKTASGEALEAANKLMSQSQYLQHILGDIIAKTHPNTASRLSSPTPQQDSPLGSRDTPKREI